MSYYEKLIQYALRILTKKRYTSFEITKKLKLFVDKQKALARKEAMENDMEESGASEDIEKVLERLKELRYLDDSGYAEDYIAEKIKFRPRGKFLLARELKLKGIDSDIIQNALEKHNLDESEIAAQALERRLKQWKDLPLQKQRERAYRFLASRGFNQDAIYKAVNSCYNERA